MASQWENLLQNAGTWDGTFIRLSPEGAIASQTPSRLCLERLGDREARFELTRFPADAPPTTHRNEFSTLSRSVLFGNDGSFTKGSMQWSPVSDFGTEFGLTLPEARLRLVQMYQRGGALDYLVLITETRAGCDPVPRPALTVEQLVGTWQGEAVTYHQDWTVSSCATHLTVTQIAPDRIEQTLTYGSQAIASQAQQVGDRLLFTQGELSYQLLLLPHGGSSLCPQTIPRVTAFVCELGWLLNATTRLRLVRQYDRTGAWLNQTWVKECKVT